MGSLVLSLYAATSTCFINMQAVISAPSGTSLDRQASMNEEDVNYQRWLSPFQIEKLSYMFKSFFDDNCDGFLQKGDIVALMDRISKYRNISKDSEVYKKVEDVMWAFYECMTDQVKVEKGASAINEGFKTWEEALKPYNVDVTNITLNQWLNMWGRLCRGAAGISGFPFWVQLLGHIFFDTIDQDQDGVLGFDEFKTYYTKLAGVKAENVEKVAKEGYRVMTANNGYELNRENYLFCFANFLLGRDIYGPGKYIFGVFDNREIGEIFQVKYNEE